MFDGGSVRAARLPESAGTTESWRERLLLQLGVRIFVLQKIHDSIRFSDEKTSYPLLAISVSNSGIHGDRILFIPANEEQAGEFRFLFYPALPYASGAHRRLARYRLQIGAPRLE